MIMKNRKVIIDDTPWGRLELHIKYGLYDIMNKLLNDINISPLIYSILVLLETIQFFYFSIHPRFKFLDKILVIE